MLRSIAFVFLYSLFLVAAGCNADPHCRREIGLMRAELVDLEDKYYLMMSQRDEALAEAGLDPEARVATEIYNDEQNIGSGVIYDRPVEGKIYYDEPVHEGEVIYEEPPASGRNRRRVGSAWRPIR